MLFRRTRDRAVAGLEWGIRGSLTTYVAQLPDGVVAVDGVADLVDGAHPPRFHFPELSRTGLEARFGGTVRIIGHRGMLRISARDPWLSFGDGSAHLSIIPGEELPRIVVADVPVPGTGKIDGETARLTSDGAAWLGPQYAAGDEASVVTYVPTSTRPTSSSARLRKGGRDDAHQLSHPQAT